MLNIFFFLSRVFLFCSGPWEKRRKSEIAKEKEGEGEKVGTPGMVSILCLFVAREQEKRERERGGQEDRKRKQLRLRDIISCLKGGINIELCLYYFFNTYLNLPIQYRQRFFTFES